MLRAKQKVGWEMSAYDWLDEKHMSYWLSPSGETWYSKKFEKKHRKKNCGKLLS